MNNLPVIDEALLLSYGATVHEHTPAEIIFEEGETPKSYYQIRSGVVKLNHIDEQGKELIQSILNPGQSVCEMLLFINRSYPVNAVTLGKCTTLKLSKPSFFKLLEDNPTISEHINKFISERLYQKFIVMQNNSSTSSQARLKGALSYFKSYHQDQSLYSYQVSLTRQQLASITGLRVETVIRAIKSLEEQEFLKIKDRKIFV